MENNYLQKPRYASLKEFLDGKKGYLFEELTDMHYTMENLDERRGNPWEYDMKFQFDEMSYVQGWKSKKNPKCDLYINQLLKTNDKNPLIRVLSYKGQYSPCNFDCDGTASNGDKQVWTNWLIREVYRTLWNWNDIKNENVDLNKLTVWRYGKSCFDDNKEVGPENYEFVLDNICEMLV